MWSKQQINQFARDIRLVWGGGWPFFTPDVRHAIVDQKILSVLQGQVSEAITQVAIRDLSTALYTEMGINA